MFIIAIAAAFYFLVLKKPASPAGNGLTVDGKIPIDPATGQPVNTSGWSNIEQPVSLPPGWGPTGSPQPGTTFGSDSWYANGGSSGSATFPPGAVK